MRLLRWMGPCAHNQVWVRHTLHFRMCTQLSNEQLKLNELNGVAPGNTGNHPLTFAL